MTQTPEPSERDATLVALFVRFITTEYADLGRIDAEGRPTQDDCYPWRFVIDGQLRDLTDAEVAALESVWGAKA